MTENEDYLYSMINDYADDLSELSRQLDNLKFHIKTFITEVKHHKNNGHNEISADWILEYLQLRI